MYSLDAFHYLELFSNHQSVIINQQSLIKIGGTYMQEKVALKISQCPQYYMELNARI